VCVCVCVCVCARAHACMHACLCLHILMPILCVWAAELWTTGGINKHITKQITNKTHVIIDAGNAVCS
jgi:hypothetical protein